MIRELCITLTVRAVTLGHTLYGVEELRSSPPPGLMACQKAQCLAVLALIQLVLLCTLFGYRRILPDDEGRQEYRAVPGMGVQRSVHGHAWDFPAGAGLRANAPALFCRNN